MGLALLSALALNKGGKMTAVERLCAILGLALSYSGQGLDGTEKAEQVLACLDQLISTEEKDDLSSLLALCLGLNLLSKYILILAPWFDHSSTQAASRSYERALCQSSAAI